MELQILTDVLVEVLVKKYGSKEATVLALAEHLGVEMHTVDDGLRVENEDLLAANKQLATELAEALRDKAPHPVVNNALIMTDRGLARAIIVEAA